jgi:hypothetical protein
MAFLNSVVNRVAARLGYIVMPRSGGPVVIDRGQCEPVRSFQKLYTGFATPDLDSDPFDRAFKETIAETPGEPRAEPIRARVYHVARLAELAIPAKGDFLFVGVAYGVFPRCIWRLLGPRIQDRKMILIDPWDGLWSEADRQTHRSYTSDMDRIERLFEAIPVQYCRGHAPDALSAVSGPLALAVFCTGHPDAELKSLPFVIDNMSDGGIIYVCAYGNTNRPNWETYRTVLSDAGLIVIDLLNGTCAAIKPASASAIG